jgi:hypothetical protein
MPQEQPTEKEYWITVQEDAQRTYDLRVTAASSYDAVKNNQSDKMKIIQVRPVLK